MKLLIVITFFIVSSFSTARPTPTFSPGVPAGVKRITPLIQAVQSGHMRLIGQLIRGGAEINAKDALGRTAAHYAVLHNNLPVLELVIAAGADANLVDNDGNSPLDYAQENGHTQAKLAALQNTTMPRDLFEAAAHNDRAGAELLLDAGADPKEKREYSKTAYDELGFVTPFHIAFDAKHYGLAAFLLRVAIGINGLDEKGWTPLMLAIVGDDWDMVRELIKYGADIFAGHGENALGVAKMMKSEAWLVDIFVEEKGANGVVHRDQLSLQPELQMAYAADVTRRRQRPLSSRAPTKIVATDETLPSAESHAFSPFEEETLVHAIGQYLLLRVRAITASVHTCTACLLDKLTSYTTTLEDSFQPVEEEIARTLAATENIVAAIVLGATTEEINQLIAQGANIERHDENGRTAVMLAALLGKWREISLLLDAGAEVNAQDNDGNTALHLALEVGHHETVALLRSRGADASTENNAGITTLALAQESGDAVLIELMQTERQPQSSVSAREDITTAARLIRRAAEHDNHEAQPQEEKSPALPD